MQHLQRLLDIISALRDPDTGCPWDLKQDYKSLVPYTLEEAYEVAEAIEQGDMDEVKKELGDLLFQVVFTPSWPKKKGCLILKILLQPLLIKWCVVIPMYSVSINMKMRPLF